MAHSPLVTTIVVNWNGRAFLEKCLSSLRAQTYQPHEVILVDNGSTDDSLDYVAATFPEVRVIRLPDNRGFAAANNVGIREATGQYVALLNNDAYAEPGWLAQMVEAAEQQTDVNAAGLALDWAGFCWEWCGGQIDDLNESSISECFGPSGAAALYRRQMLDEIGLFDEEFFAYAEDADLNWRALRAGWRCLYVPGARVYHITSATAGEGSRFKSYLLGRNKIWLLLKNVPGGRYLWWWPLLIGYDLLSVAWGLISRRDSSAVAGRLAALRGLLPMWRKRRTSPTRTNDYLKLLKPLQAPWQISARFRYRQTAKT
jgi:GT2 family glycosyltransferase